MLISLLEGTRLMIIKYKFYSLVCWLVGHRVDEFYTDLKRYHIKYCKRCYKQLPSRDYHPGFEGY